MNKIKTNDTVMLLAGKDKGKKGVVLRVYINGKTGKPSAVVVKGINVALKHKKANPQQNIEGGIIPKEMPVDISNVALFNPVTGKADRVGIKDVEGVKRRFFKSNGELVDL